MCCMQMRTPPFYGESDPRWKALPEAMQHELARYLLMVKHDGPVNPCIWLDILTRKCRHYNLRPGVCRDFEVGNDSCRSFRKDVGLTVKGMPIA